MLRLAILVELHELWQTQTDIQTDTGPYGILHDHSLHGKMC